VAPAYTVAVAAAALPRGDLNRVLGTPPAPTTAQAQAEPALASRFKLLGVAAPREGGDRYGLALIAVDGKPARSFKVGAPIEGELVLQTVHPRGAAVGVRGGVAQVNLELPALPQPATSSRPPGTTGAPQPGFGGLTVPVNAPIATLPPPVAGVPPNSEAQEPVPVPPPPGQSPSHAATR
jgi:general secretion pathway protein C